MHDPLMMDSATLKLILIEKMNSYLSVFSILISVYELYWIPQDDTVFEYVRWLSAGLTMLLMVQIGFGVYLHYENTLVRRGTDRLFILWEIPKVIAAVSYTHLTLPTILLV